MEYSLDGVGKLSIVLNGRECLTDHNALSHCQNNLYICFEVLKLVIPFPFSSMVY